MVLSNKRRKQLLRDAKAELTAASGVVADISKDLGSEKSNSVINPESQNPSISKREKRRQKTSSDIVQGKALSNGVEGKKEADLTSDIPEVKKKKRKRDEIKNSEDVKDKKKAEQPKKKKKKIKKKKKKPNEKLENGKLNEEMGGKPTGEQNTKADAITIINRREDAEVPGKVYVGGIPYYSTEDDIRSYFEHCGTITDIDCMTFSDTGKFRGIAIISFKTEAASKRALALDGSDMGGLFLKIQPFKSAKVNKLPNFAPTVLEGYNRIYVGNLSWDLTEDDLRKLFSECTITSIRFGEDKDTGEFKGYGHVDFADGLSLNKALKLDQTIVCGRPIKISCAVPKSGTLAKPNSMPKDNQVNSFKVVSAVSEGQIYSSQAESVNVNAVSDSATIAVNSKIRRRTCYECGEKGHLSSDCPKQVAAVPNSGTLAKLDSMPKDNQVNSLKVVSAVTKEQTNSSQYESVVVNAFSEDILNNSSTNAVSSKIRRRTCYECGEKGHLSSDCPKQVAAVPNSGTPAKLDSMPKDNQVNSLKVVSAVTEEQINSFQYESVVANAFNEVILNNSSTNAVNSKIRRRTCYECGEKGHLSSACPKKLAADAANGTV